MAMAWMAAVLALATAGGAAGEAADCRAQAGFDRGHAGVAALEACTAADYRSGWRLGSELAALEAERRALLAADGAGDDGRRARRIRQLSVDIEAIGAALQLRGIIQEGPRPAPASSAEPTHDVQAPAADRP